MKSMFNNKCSRIKTKVQRKLFMEKCGDVRSQGFVSDWNWEIPPDRGLKELVILERSGFQQEFILGPLCCWFSDGFRMEIVACSSRFSCDLVDVVVKMDVLLQLILWHSSWACLAGADLIFPVSESVWLFNRKHASCSLILVMSCR